MAKQKVSVSADHPAAAYKLDSQIVEVDCSRGEWSASRPGFGYVCGFATRESAIRDLLQANGCTNIRIEESSK